MKESRASAAATTAQAAQVAETEAHAAQADTFPVAGIVASAGGLDAFKRFFDAMPADCGIAFVLIPHLDPTHESLMVQLMQRHTAMPVVEATQDMELTPNRVHVIPPNRYMTLAGGRLRLTGPVTSNPPTSIDLFLRSLAADCAERAVCVILSGSGSHGALGLKEIKAAGGLALVQLPETAEHARMPESALETGVADVALPVEQIPGAILGYVRGSGTLGPAVHVEAPVDLVAHLIALLRARTGIDFGPYRPTMLSRRVYRRMRLLGIEEHADYLALLNERAEELDLLASDLLISVTHFMRDPGAYDALRREVIAPLVRSRVPGAPLRVWSAGCATGEEAYSIGMLLLEEMGERSSHSLRVFATDVSGVALDVARRGVYPGVIAGDLDPGMLTRHFTPSDDGGFQVSKRLRSIVTFARHDLLGDPPYSRLDLIVCRNLLIYFEPEVQARLLSMMYYALNEGGYLLLGHSENITRNPSLFDPVSRKWRIFRRSGSVRVPRMQRPAMQVQRNPAGRRELPLQAMHEESFAQLMRDALIEHFAPAAALVAPDGEVLYLHGAADRYLALGRGVPRPYLAEMAREGLAGALRGALRQATREESSVILSDAQVKRDGRYCSVVVTVRPVRGQRGVMLVSFRDSARTALQTRLPPDASEETRLAQLEKELRATRDDLQSTIEELETTNEELKASNEEVMSMNEELHSGNEELESSHEELQSLNEELSATNEQLQEKLAELETAGADMTNLLAASDVASVFLDQSLQIRWFTPAATAIFNLQAQDTGRPLQEIAARLEDPELVRDIERVLYGERSIERELHSPERLWWLRRVLPYKREHYNDGVVVSYVDITERHLAADNTILHLAGIVNAAADAILSKDLDGIIRTWNPGAERLYGYSAAEAIGRSAEILVPPELHEEWDKLMARARAGDGIEMETERVARDGRVIPVALTVSPVRNTHGAVTGIVVTARDIGERLRSNQALRDREQRLQAILSTALDAIVIVDREGRLVSVNPATTRLFGYAAEELIGADIGLLMPSSNPAEPHGLISRYIDPNDMQHEAGWPEFEARRSDGTGFPVELAVSPMRALGLLTVIIRDVSQRKELEREVVESVSRLQHRIGQDLHDTVGQELTALNLLTGDLAEVLRTGGGQAPKLLGQMARGLQRVRDELRSVMKGLIPVPVDTEGLMAALEDLTDRTRRENPVNCIFECEEPVTVSDNFSATHLFLIAQEAVRNAVTHARPRNITVSLSRNGAVCLAVEDDGTGLPELGENHPGLGLRIMRNRARLLGAHFDIERVEPNGTRMQCILSSHDDDTTKTGTNPDR